MYIIQQKILHSHHGHNFLRSDTVFSVEMGDDNNREVRTFKFFEFTQVDRHDGAPPNLLNYKPLEYARYNIKIIDIFCIKKRLK